MLKIYNLKDKPKYLDEVATLEYNEWADTPRLDYETRIKRKKEKMKNQLKENQICKLILLSDDELVGFISIFPHDCDELPELTPWYSTMYVKENFRKRGFSKILNDAILEEAKKKNIKTLYLKTELRNYYEKFGAVFVQKINDHENLYKFEIWL